MQRYALSEKHFLEGKKISVEVSGYVKTINNIVENLGNTKNKKVNVPLK